MSWEQIWDHLIHPCAPESLWRAGKDRHPPATPCQGFASTEWPLQPRITLGEPLLQLPRRDHRRTAGSCAGRSFSYYRLARSKGRWSSSVCPAQTQQIFTKQTDLRDALKRGTFLNSDRERLLTGDKLQTRAAPHEVQKLSGTRTGRSRILADPRTASQTAASNQMRTWRRTSLRLAWSRVFLRPQELPASALQPTTKEGKVCTQLSEFLGSGNVDMHPWPLLSLLPPSSAAPRREEKPAPCGLSGRTFRSARSTPLTSDFHLLQFNFTNWNTHRNPVT